MRTALYTVTMARRAKVVSGVGAAALAVAAVFGVMAGLGAFTFVFADGHAYLSSDPTACTNCHIMQDYYDSWLTSGHHHVATCVDCHLPHDFLGKYISKADNGFFHSLAFTLENFHEPIQIKPRNRRITQANCVACHETAAHALLPEEPDGDMMMCIHCHAGVGHSFKSRARVWQD